MAKSLLEISGIEKSFTANNQSEKVLVDVSFSLSEGRLIALCGKSGSGKTTLLRIIAGLEKPDIGTVLVSGKKPSEIYPRIGYVVQDYSESLLPWLRVRSNVALGMLKAGYSKRERLKRADHYLKLVGLAGHEAKYPWQLSGGMQQRAVIARALAVDPVLLCLDEPFASVDAQTRAELQDLVLSLCKQSNIATVLVTHDLDEAVYMADEILVLTKGEDSATTVTVPIPWPRSQESTRYLDGFLEIRKKLNSLILR